MQCGHSHIRLFHDADVSKASFIGLLRISFSAYSEYETLMYSLSCE